MSIAIFSGVLTLLFIFTLSACIGAKGSIVILENGRGTGFTMDLKEYNSKSKCELSLVKGDVVQVEIECKEGEIAISPKFIAITTAKNNAVLFSRVSCLGFALFRICAMMRKSN